VNKVINCKNLKQSEKIFIKKVKNINLLGDIYISKEELEKITILIKNSLSYINSNYSLYKIKTPITISLFLVWKGVYEYQEGNYWDAIYEALDCKDSKLNEIFGEIFYYALQKYNLPQFKVGRIKYVTQILVHGYIPDQYTAEFCNDFLYPEFCEFFMVSSDKNYVKTRMKSIISDYKEHSILKEQELKLINKINNLKREILRQDNILNNWNKLQELKVIKKELIDNKVLSHLFKEPLDFLKQKEGQINRITESIYKKELFLRELQQKNQEINRIKKLYKKKKQILEDKKKSLETVKNTLKRLSWDLLDTTWEDKYAEPIKGINLDKLKVIINDYHIDRVKKWQFNKYLKNIIKKVLIFFKIKKIENALKEALQGLSLKDSYRKMLNWDLYNKVSRLKTLITEYAKLQKEIEQNKEFIKNLTDTAATIEEDISLEKVNLEDKMENAQNNIIKLKKQQEMLKKEIRDYKMDLTILSDGIGYEKGSEILKQQYELNEKVNSIKTEIDIDQQTIEEVLNNEITLDKEKVKQTKNKTELENYKKQLNALEEQLTLYPERLYRLIESIRVLILQGGDIALNFIYNCLVFLKYLNNGENRLSVNLNDNVKKGIEKWWEEHLKEETPYEEVEVAGHTFYIRNIRIRYSVQDRQLYVFVPAMDREIPEKFAKSI
jgi:hypothetical protein